MAIFNCDHYQTLPNAGIINSFSFVTPKIGIQIIEVITGTRVPKCVFWIIDHLFSTSNSSVSSKLTVSI